MDTKIDFQNKTSNVTSFISWKPIVYKDNSRATTNSLKLISPTKEDNNLTDESLLRRYFHAKHFYANKLTYFQFNSEQDSDFEFTNTTFIEFTFTCSLGDLSEKTFSKFITITIISLLFIFIFSLILFIFSIAFSFIRRRFFPSYDDLGNSD